MSAAATPQTKYLKDYKVPDFLIDTIHLAFELFDDVSYVTATTKFKRNGAHKNALVLDGHTLKLISVTVDGKTPEHSVDDAHLTIPGVPDAFTLVVKSELHPEKNTTLEGLYRSNTMFCTQCEAEGFRTITYTPDRPDVMAKYTTRIEADKKKYPVLLSNGNCTAKGDLPDNRHFTVWEDPFRKPGYLFALVAGDLNRIHDTFKTMSGRTVDLYIYSEPGNEDKCQHAMTSLKKSMKWDEDAYGREYDLDLFNIVAVNDFNFGAMENKSLNIFNSKLVFAKPDTATDGDYLAIEGVIAHEYFHNWTGNRITCRDWFQLSLKEGLTVFRDQMFSSDMNSAAAMRISDVQGLRNAQFPEDAGPLAHPVRPDNYMEINNFYTATVYEKGAEVLRMMRTILGQKLYRKATDLYFERHDGQAVTCDDFAKCMEDASGIDLSQFKLWYSQAGTPEITVKTAYDEKAKVYKLTLSQHLADKKPMHIPVALGLLSANGQDLLPEGTRVVHLKEKEQVFTFENIATRPVPSLFRDFSAPVKVKSDLTDADLRFLMTHDTDGFNRWDSGQTYLQRRLLDLVKNPGQGVPADVIDAFKLLLSDTKTDKMLLANALGLPSDAYLAQLMDIIDVDGIANARDAVAKSVGKALYKELTKLYSDNVDTGAYSVSPAAMGKRALKNTALRYLMASGEKEAVALANTQFQSAKNMTDRVAALSLLSDTTAPEREAAFDSFYKTFHQDPNVLNKWFMMQVTADRKDAPEIVENLMKHPDFTLKNPNRLRSVIGVFANSNQRWFHRIDGKGYDLLASTVIALNKINPMTASRLLNPMREWKRFDDKRKALMQKQLERILDIPDLAPELYEIVSKSLGADHVRKRTAA